MLLSSFWWSDEADLFYMPLFFLALCFVVPIIIGLILVAIGSTMGVKAMENASMATLRKQLSEEEKPPYPPLKSEDFDAADIPFLCDRINAQRVKIRLLTSELAAYQGIYGKLHCAIASPECRSCQPRKDPDGED
jgi:hypothetical protein